MRDFLYTSIALSALALAGCSSAPSASLGSDDTSLTVSVPEGGTLDLRFEPQQLRTGERISVEFQGLRLESAAGRDGHAVRLYAPGRTVRRVAGLTDGQLQAAVDLDASGGANGGMTAKTPTSVHKIRVCNADACADALEYDYDLHAPTGEGSTAWRTPDGRSVTIDRLRFELAADSAASVADHRASQNRRPVLTITAPEPLTVVR